MATFTSPDKKEAQGDPGGGVLSQEKLIEKYKAALSIAQKAKNARDEAVKSNKLLQAENEELKAKIKNVEKQYGTAEEMLGVLTDQKLKLAMEIDDLRKEKTVFLSELKSKESAEIEAESYKRQFNRALKDNDALIARCESTEKTIHSLQKEIEEVKKTNENLKISCHNIQGEQSDLEKRFNETLEKLNKSEEDQKILDQILSQKYNVAVANFQSWVRIIETDVNSKSSENDGELMLENHALKREMEKFISSVDLLSKDKENMEQEIVYLNDRIKNIMTELDVANVDRDKMMNSLEKVGVETKQLVENCEKMSEEIESLKTDKSQIESRLKTSHNEKNILSKVIEENKRNIYQLTSEILEYQESVRNLECKLEISTKKQKELANLDLMNCEDMTPNELVICQNVMTDTTDLFGERSSGQCVLEKCHKFIQTENDEQEFNNDESPDRERLMSLEMEKLQSQMQSFSEEIVKYKCIANESQVSYTEIVEELQKKNELLDQQSRKIVDLESENFRHEQLNNLVHSNLLECKTELMSALENLAIVERMQTNLEINSTDQVVLEEQQSIINKKCEQVDQLEKELNNKNLSLGESNKQLKEFREVASQRQNEIVSLMGQINELKISLNQVVEENKCKFQKYQVEINELKGQITEYVKCNENLTFDNSKLNKQIKELLNEQAEENDSLLKKLTYLQGILNSSENVNKEKTKEKQTLISNLEQEITLLKVQLQEQIDKNTLLKEKIEEIKKNSEGSTKLLSEKMESINGLEADISILKMLNTEYEKTNKDLSQENIEIAKQTQEIQESKTKIEEENIRLKEEINNLRNELANFQKNSNISLDEKNAKIKELLYKVDKIKTNHKEDTEEKNILISRLKEEIKEISLQNENFVLQSEKFKEENLKISNELVNLKSSTNFSDEELKKELDLKMNIINDFEKEIESKNHKIEDLVSKNTFLFNEKDELNDKLLILTAQKEDSAVLKQKISQLESSLKEMENSNTKILQDKKNEDISLLTDEINELKIKINDLSKINENLSLDNNNFQTVFDSLKNKHSQEINEFIDKYSNLTIELNNTKELLNFKIMELEENNRIWAGRLSYIKIALIGLNKAKKEIENLFISSQKLISSFMAQIREPLEERVRMVIEDSLRVAKHDLISEMHQMNQVLKERGETISKLEFSLNDHMNEIERLTRHNSEIEAEFVKLKNTVGQNVEILTQKELIIKELESEIVQLKESHDNNTDTDMLSTSTISRSEEHSRLRDVEDSLEDRYMKLKLIAVKLKKKVGELTQTLESERSKMLTEKTELLEKISGMSVAVKNSQKLQELFDQKLDEMDEVKKKNSKLESALEEIKSSEEDLKSKINSLESNNQKIPVMKKHIDSLNAVIKDAKSDIQKLQMENKAEIIKYDELKKQSTKLETRVQELTQNLEQAKLQGKNSNVLELEMKNYEKIIADLSSQLNIEKNTTANLRSENESLSSMKVGLEDQITILEKQIKTEEERTAHTNEQLSLCRGKVEEYNSQIETLNVKIENLQKELNSEKNKCEALTLETSTITSDFSKTELVMQSRIESLQVQVRSLETALHSTKQELTTSKSECEHLQQEYESYRLRAQTILAKRKGDFVTHGEKEAREEVEKLKNEIEMMREKFESNIQEVDTLNTRISTLTLEKARNDKRYEEIRSALQQKIVDYDILSTEFHKLKLNSETTFENLKAESERKRKEYLTELSNHKKLIEEMVSEFELRENSNPETLKDRGGHDLGNPSPPFNEGDPLPQVREEGEGSESVPSPKARRHSSLVPLDILLNNPILDENKVVILQEQLEKLRKELTSYELRSRHLSSLLSEAEKDSARNQHQNKILKEELRRLERSLERQPHIANTEYLKNVVFKFITLPIGDERSRLVPVLDTILKLSPEETQKLNSVAKGDTNVGWGSYLPSWTGL